MHIFLKYNKLNIILNLPPIIKTFSFTFLDAF